MATLINSETHEPEEWDPADIYRALNSGGYEFGDSQVPVMVQESSIGEPTAYGLSPADAKEYILSGAGTYMTPEVVNKWREKKKYGEGYVPHAAALGVADSLTFGGTSMLLNNMGIQAEALSGRTQRQA